MSDFDTITDLATEVANLKDQLALMQGMRDAALEDLNRVSATVTTLQVQRSRATTKFQNYLDALVDAFGMERVCEVLDVPTPTAEYTVTIPVSAPVSITVNASSRVQALDPDILQNNHWGDIRQAIESFSTYSYDIDYGSATADSWFTPSEPTLSIDLFTEGN